MKITKLKIENLDFSYRVLLSIIFVLGAILIIFVRLQFKPEKSFAAWFDDSYTYRQTITITHNANLFTNQAIGVSVSTSGLVSAVKMQSDCDDTRFTDAAGKVLPYKLVSGCNGTNTQYTVVLPKVNNGTNYIYVYYGNPTATSNSQDVSGYTPLTPSTPGPAAASEENTPGPLAYWKFNEGVGLSTFDSTQNKFNANFGAGAAAPTWKTDDQCINGKCLYFDGSNDYLNVSYLAANNLTAGNISMWIKFTTTTVSQSFFSKQHNASDSMLIFQTNASSQFQFQLKNTAGFTTGTTTATTGTWYFVSANWNGSTQNLYVNGQLEGTISTAQTLPNDSSAISIGAWTGDGNNYGEEYIDEVKIYPYARTAAQVLADYNSRGSVHGSSANLGNLDISGTGPIAYWNFEEGVGTSVYDTGTSANNGTFGTGNSAPSWASGKFGKGLSFDGVNDKVVVTQPTTTTTNVTLQAWIYPTALSQNDGLVIHNGTNSATGGYGISYGGQDTSNSKLFILFSGIIWFDTGYTFPAANAWYHVAITRDATTWRAYVNGVQTPLTTTQDPAAPTATYFEIGHQPQFSGRHFAGLIDEVKVYNYPRTQKQIIADMNGGHPAGGSPVGSQLGYWKFDEGVGGTAFNTGSVGSTINANLGSGTSSPTWNASGVFNKALSFDGNDYTTVPETGDLRFPTTAENFTLSAWVKRSGVGTTQYILSKEDSDNDGWRLLFDGANTITCSIGATDVTSTLTVTDTTTWHHVACAMDRAGTGQVYLDGKPASSATSIAGQVLNTTTALTIGSRSYTPTFFFNGLIDEVKIYSSQLTASEILIDYNRGQAIQQGSLSTGAGNTNPATAGSQEYCVPGDTAVCSPPIGEWKFEEGIGTSAYNTGTSGLNGGLISSPAWSSSKIGKGLTFDGSSNYVQLNSTSLDPLTSDWTETVWVKLPNGSSGPDAILAKRTVGTDASITIRTNDPNGNTVDCAIDTNSIFYGKGSSKTINDGNWHYIACTRTGNTINLYIDGILDNATSYTSGTPSSSISSANAWQFGRHPAWNFYMNGSIDQIRMYNYVRTPAQIAWEYNQGKPVVQFKLDECQGTTVYDSMGTGYTGTWSGSGGGTQTSTGTCTTNAATAWYNGRTGKINSSINFDGSDDYLNLGTNPIFAPTGNNLSGISWGGWFYPTSYASTRTLISNDTEIDLDLDTSGHPLCNTYWDGGLTANAAGSNARSANLNSWNHILCVYDNQTLRVYLNGQLSDTWTQDPLIADNNSLRIGLDSSFTQYYSGMADDVRLYNYALTATQVQLLYNSGAGVNFAPVTGAP